MLHSEHHTTHRIGWLRAAVLGANDGIISTASLLVGLTQAHAAPDTVLTTGIAALVAGAASMAAGEYVSVAAQDDAQNSEIAKEKAELIKNPEAELRELTGIYQERGLTPALANEVALALTRHDALQAHIRDEIGITQISAAQPMRAALSSAAAFSVGAALPVAGVFISLTLGLTQPNVLSWGISASCVLCLAVLGYLAAALGGGKRALAIKAGLRVALWGIAAMGFTAWVGQWMQAGFAP